MASRLEALAASGSLLISDKVYNEIKNHNEILSHFIGKVLLKNVSDPLDVYSIVNEPLVIPSMEDLSKKGRIRPKTIAVLPFVNMNGSEEDDFFSDGVTEEILNVLARIDQIQVTSRTSSFFFKNKSLNIKDIGASLNVEYVLEGSIRKSGSKVRITAQLIQVSDDFHLWSDRYDRDLKDIFAIQDEIAEKISKQLTLKLGIGLEETKIRRITNTEAHDAYLKGRYYFNKWSPESVKKGIIAFQEAIDIDPLYAEAYAGMANCYIWLGLTGYDTRARWKASVSAYKSFELNPDNEDAILSLAMVKTLYEKEIHEANLLFTKALKINPDYATAHHFYAMYLAHIGSLEQALIEYKRAIQLDPLSLVINSEYSTALASLGQLDQALIQINKTIELNKNFRTAWEVKGWVYFMMKKYALSIEAFTKYQSLTDSTDKGLTGLAIVNAIMGNTEKTRTYLEIMLERKLSQPTVLIDIDLAMVYLSLEEVDVALDYLDKGLSKGQGSLFLNTMPYFRRLKGNERFEGIKAKYLQTN
ncbi:MAG: adenylate cyclase [Saprospiraceae bacterium]